MVEILEKIKLVTKQRAEILTNAYKEVQCDYTYGGTYIFEKGKIYGIIGEYGEGGETISSIMSGKIITKEEEIYYDDVKIENPNLQEIGWYVGKSEYRKGLIKREVSVRKALSYAVKKYKRYNSVDEVVEDFHLTPERLNLELWKYSGEKWRASLAIGYACRKEIYCFSWMNTISFTNIMISSGVFRFFKRMKEEGLIVILPTSRKENVIGLADEIIEIDTSRYKRVISENPYFIEHF